MKIIKSNFIKINLLIIIMNTALIEEFITYVFIFTDQDVNIANYTSQLIYIFTGIYIIFDFMFNQSKNKGKVLLIFIIMTILFGHSYYKFFDYKDHIITTYITFLSSGYFVYYLSSNCDIKIHKFKILDFFLILSIIVGFFYIFSPLNLNNQMLLAYSILPFTIYAMIKFKYEKSIKNLLLFLLLIIFIIIFENRGSIIILAISSLILLFNNKVSYKVIISILITLSLIFTTLLFIVVLKIDFENRILSNIFNGNFFQDNSRIIIWKELINKFLSSPFKFNGLLFDRYYLVESFHDVTSFPIYISKDNFTGLYSHNLFVEYLLTFGILFTILITLFIIRKSYINYKSIDKKYRYFYMIILSYTFINLMISSSFIINSWFWLLIGLSMNNNKNIFNIRIKSRRKG